MVTTRQKPQSSLTNDSLVSEPIHTKTFGLRQRLTSIGRGRNCYRAKNTEDFAGRDLERIFERFHRVSGLTCPLCNLRLRGADYTIYRYIGHSIMSQPIRDTLTTAMKEAMKAKDKKRLGTIRQLLAAFKQVEVDERIQIDDQRALQILDKQAKQRKDSMTQFEEAGRTDLATQEQFELDVIQSFLPQALTEEEVNAIIQAAITDAQPESMKDMGRVMAIVKPQVQGRADMGTISRIVKERLN